jgi:hypothetical protein
MMDGVCDSIDLVSCHSMLAAIGKDQIRRKIIRCKITDPLQRVSDSINLVSCNSMLAAIGKDQIRRKII